MAGVLRAPANSRRCQKGWAPGRTHQLSNQWALVSKVRVGFLHSVECWTRQPLMCLPSLQSQDCNRLTPLCSPWNIPSWNITRHLQAGPRHLRTAYVITALVPNTEAASVLRNLTLTETSTKDHLPTRPRLILRSRTPQSCVCSPQGMRWGGQSP